MSPQVGHVALRMALGLGLMVAVAQLGRITRGTTETGSALSVAVRTRATSADRCRERTEAELQKLPVHMRQKMLCERGWIAYDFSVEIDGKTVDQRTVAPAGAFGDRPLVLASQTPVEPGTHRVHIRLHPNAPSDISASVTDLDFEQNLTFRSGRSLLVSLDPDGSWDLIGAAAE